jgi:hypothetical protein
LNDCSIEINDSRPYLSGDPDENSTTNSVCYTDLIHRRIFLCSSRYFTDTHLADDDCRDFTVLSPTRDNSTAPGYLANNPLHPTADGCRDFANSFPASGDGTPHPCRA